MATDEERYLTLVKRHQKHIWWLCFCYAPRNSALCEDLVQEAGIAIWNHLGTLSPDASYWEEWQWVDRRTRDILRTLHRRQQRQPPLEDITPELAENVPFVDDYASNRERVEELLETLPEQDRRLMQMRLDGYDAKEIGQALGIEPNTVYQRANRILKRLQKQHNNKE